MVLKNNWKLFKEKTRGLNILESFQTTDEHFWRMIQAFVYEAEPCSLIIPRPPPAPPKRCEYDNWDTISMFQNLGTEVRERVRLEKSEHDSIVYALMYLEAETKLQKHQRDLRMCNHIWKEVQPQLERLGLMAKLKNANELKRRLTMFLTGER